MPEDVMPWLCAHARGPGSETPEPTVPAHGGSRKDMRSLISRSSNARWSDPAGALDPVRSRRDVLDDDGSAGAAGHAREILRRQRGGSCMLDGAGRPVALLHALPPWSIL